MPPLSKKKPSSVPAFQETGFDTTGKVNYSTMPVSNDSRPKVGFKSMNFNGIKLSKF
jgi:hypothetical protein